MLVDLDRQHVPPQLGGGGTALQVALGKEGLDLARKGFGLPLPEADLVAVGQEDVGDLKLGRVGLGLGFGFGRVDSRLLGFDDGEGAAVAIAQHVVGLGAVGQHVLEPHGVRVRDLPALVAELGVDLDARERFVGHPFCLVAVGGQCQQARVGLTVTFSTWC